MALWGGAQGPSWRPTLSTLQALCGRVLCHTRQVSIESGTRPHRHSPSGFSTSLPEFTPTLHPGSPGLRGETLPEVTATSVTAGGLRSRTGTPCLLVHTPPPHLPASAWLGLGGSGSVLWPPPIAGAVAPSCLSAYFSPSSREHVARGVWDPGRNSFSPIFLCFPGRRD